MSLIPSWWRIAVAAALLLGAYGWGRMDGAAPVQAKLERERAEAAQRQAAAVTAELIRGNETADLLRKNHADAEEVRKMDRKRADEAIAARDRSDAMARRVRDASATDLLAARAEIESAGLAGQCAPALEAASVRERMLGELDDVTSRIGGFAVEVSRFADQAYSASAECAAAYKVIAR